MKKTFAILLSLLIILAGCTREETSMTSEAYVDDLGRTVSIGSADRVAVLIGSFADIWCLAGGHDSIVAAADDAWTQFDLGLPEGIVNTGAVRSPNLEKILAADPDLVIASSKTGADVALKDRFEEMGIPVLYFEVSGFDDYLRMLDICTSITGCRENYERYGTALVEQVESAKAMADGSSPRVLYVRASGSGVRVKNSENSVLGEMLEDLGCINIADSETGLLENLSMETIIREDPDWIFGVIQGSTNYAKAEEALRKTLLEDPAWDGLTAVKEGRFVMLDQKMYNLKPNAGWGKAYMDLAEVIYEKDAR